MITTSRLLRFILTLAFMLGATQLLFAQEQPGFTSKQILNDPNDFVGGNPRGNLTIAVFSDYNCPYCKKAKVELDKVVAEDGQIRVVYKEWPVLSEASAVGSKVALAAKYQGKYKQAHDAMMAIPGGKITAQQMIESVRAAGLDMERLDRDLREHDKDITAILRNIYAQGNFMGFQSTPSYIIGRFRVSTALDYKTFKKAIADARKMQTENSR